MAVTRLIAREATFFAFGFGMQPISIGVKLTLGEIFVPFDVKFCAKFASFVPCFAFFFESVNVSSKIIMFA